MLHGPTALIAVDGVTLGCAGCHAGALYGADGRATDTVWAGVPNASLDLDGYTRAVYEGLKLAVADPTRARRRAHELFPDMGVAERFALRYFVLPRAKKRVAELVKQGDAPLPFHSGGPGLTNGVAALKHNLGFSLGGEAHIDETAFVSIPELSNRALRSSLLADGIYAPRGDDRFAPRTATPGDSAHVDRLAEIISFFVVPTMGVAADAAEQGIPRVTPVVRWLATTYRSPPFPASIDSVRGAEGERVYAARCAECHGTYGEGRPRALRSFPNRLVPQAAMGTDSSRWSLIDRNVETQLAPTAFGRHMTVARTGGYVAPILSGVWASAPYLHNGSVPTIWHLLTPEERPSTFLVGGHALDYERLGIALDDSGRYRSGYTPWSTPTMYDTRAAGKSNRGHEREVAGLGEAQKRALIEYLKTL
jgi:mono/diheme cytochrome c family protein